MLGGSGLDLLRARGASAGLRRSLPGFWNPAAIGSQGTLAANTRKDLHDHAARAQRRCSRSSQRWPSEGGAGNVVLQFAEFVHGAGVIINAGSAITDRRNA